jgi:peptidylprolyl isomerase
MRAIVAGLLVVAAALGVAAPGATAEGDLVLEAVLERPSVKLGEDAVLVLTVTNRAASAASVPALRLAKDSVTVRVAWAGGAAAVSRLYGTFLEDVGGLEFRPAPTPRRTLDSGGVLSGRIAFPAVAPGELTLTAVLAESTPSRVAARPVVLEVQPRTGTARRLTAQVETTKGSFTIDLDGASAFNSVAHFWLLARDGYYDGLPFHRVLPSLLAQTGDPWRTGAGGVGWFLPAEQAAAAPARGDVGLARGAHPDSAAGQWFVVADRAGAARSALDRGFVRLGTVTDGLDVVDQLAANETDPRTERPKSPDRVVAVRPSVR